jgi:small subunit ribosomal protein S1
MAPETLNPLLDGSTTDAATLDAAEFEKLFGEILNDKEIKEGSVVEGTVIRMSGDHVVVDIDYKSEGTIPVWEFRPKDAPRGAPVDVKVGDTVEVYLESLEGRDGQLVLSKEKADMMKAWDKIQEAVNEDRVVVGTIVARVKGGLSVDIGVKAFLPGSQVDLRPVKNLDRLIGAKADFKIIKFNKGRGNIVLSRRVLLEEERSERRDETLKKIKIGAIIDGTVKNITDYGAFIDLGGIDGLLHITDMSWGRINHPSQMFDVGDEVQVRILKYDADSQRVSLGYKQLREDPWSHVGDTYPIGSVVRGKVVSMPDYGIFIELEEGIEGLVHISEMTWNKRIKHPSKLVELDSEVEAVVLDIDLDQKRISLGMKQLGENPWDVVEQNYPVGTLIKGNVRNITDFGIFVGIEDGIDGLVHISDLSWSQRVRHPSERYAKGDEVEAKVLKIDKINERFSLGIKQLSEDPWRSAAARFFLSQELEGKVVHHADFGIFVELEEGVEGLVHISELSSDITSDRYEVGKTLPVEVISIDPHEQKIGLAEGGDAPEGEERRPASQQSASATLGDALGAEMLEALGASKIEDPAAEEAPEKEAAAEEAPAEEAAAEEAPAEEAAAEEAPVEEAAAEEAPVEEAPAEEAPAEEAAAEEAPVEEAPAEDADAGSEDEAASESDDSDDSDKS